MFVHISLVRDYKLWKPCAIDKKYIQQVAAMVMYYFPNFYNTKVEITVLLSNDNRLKELNSTYRKINKSTDVLSFPDMHLNWHDILEFKPSSKYVYLGDIAFSFDDIADYANHMNIGFQKRFTHLLIHSILHLLGYEHDTEEGFQVMQELENSILLNFNF